MAEVDVEATEGATTSPGTGGKLGEGTKGGKWGFNFDNQGNILGKYGGYEVGGSSIVDSGAGTLMVDGAKVATHFFL